MYKFSTKEKEIVPRVPFRVMAKDENGKIKGEYNGYFKPEKDEVTLYPIRGHRLIYGVLTPCAIDASSLVKED